MTCEPRRLTPAQRRLLLKLGETPRTREAALHYSPGDWLCPGRWTWGRFGRHATDVRTSMVDALLGLGLVERRVWKVDSDRTPADRAGLPKPYLLTDLGLEALARLRAEQPQPEKETP